MCIILHAERHGHIHVDTKATSYMIQYDDNITNLILQQRQTKTEVMQYHGLGGSCSRGSITPPWTSSGQKLFLNNPVGSYFFFRSTRRDQLLPKHAIVRAGGSWRASTGREGMSLGSLVTRCRGRSAAQRGSRCH